MHLTTWIILWFIKSCYDYVYVKIIYWTTCLENDSTFGQSKEITDFFSIKFSRSQASDAVRTLGKVGRGVIWEEGLFLSSSNRNWIFSCVELTVLWPCYIRKIIKPVHESPVFKNRCMYMDCSTLILQATGRQHVLPNRFTDFTVDFGDLWCSGCMESNHIKSEMH